MERTRLRHRLFRAAARSPRSGSPPPLPSARPATSTTSISPSAARTRSTPPCASSATPMGAAARRRRTSSSRSSSGYHGSSTVGAGLTALPAFHAGFGVPLSTGSTRSRPITPTATRRVRRRRRSSRPPSAALRAKVAELGADRVARLLCRADPGLRRRHRAAAGLAEGDAGAVPRASTSCSSPTRSSPASAAPARCSPARDEDVVPDHDDGREGPDLRLRADGRRADVRPRLQHDRRWRAAIRRGRPWPHLFRAPGQRRGRARGPATSTRTGCWRTGAVHGRAAAWPGSPALPAIRWSARCAGAACWRRSNSWRTRRARPSCPPPPIRRAAYSSARGINGLVIRAFGEGVLGYAPAALLHGRRDRRDRRAHAATLDQTLADPDVRAAMA